jgi:hypothetical protein
MRIREHEESQNSPSLSPETELTGESINPWNVNESSETGEYAIGHSPWSGPAEEPSVGGLEDLGKEAHSKGNVDKALERMRIREYEESQNSPSLTPEDPELAGVRTEGWLDSTTEEPMGMLDDLRAETQAGEFEGVERDENDPAVKEMKEVQNNPEARKEIFKDMSKEETAMAKEEYGNYYIGPGGYAINLNKLGERKEQFRREAKFSMLQYIPDHAKPQMLASWGFIDQEDVDASPDDPKVQEQKIKVAGALALQEMVKEGLISVANINSDGTFRNTKELTRSREEISKGQYQNNTDLATMNNAVKKEITGMGIEWNKVKLKADEVMHMDDNELKRWGIQFKGDMDMEQLHMVRDHFKKEMKFKYSKIRGIEKFQTAQLGQQGEQFKLTHGLKTTDQQQGWLVKQHTMMLQKAKQLLDNGNPTAAMMVYQAAGSDVEIDIPGYWKKQAKSSAFGNAKVGAAFSEMGFSTDNKNLNTGINGFVNEKKSIRKKYNDDAIDESTGMTKLDSWVKLNERNRNFSKDPLGPAWSEMNSKEQEAYPGGRPAWKAVMVSKVLKFEIGQGIYGGVAKAMEGGKINIDKTSKNKKGGNDNGKITPTVEPVEKAKKVEQSTPEGPKTTYGGPIQDILKDVYASRKKQIGMDGKTPKHTPGTLVNKEKMRKASLATGKKDLDKAIGTKIKGKLKYGGTPEKALDHFSQYPQELERLRNLDLKHYIMNELNKREVQGKIGF